ncbi:zinc-finger domain of monoamine-oxidase A repressor R1-domain-containing protein [Obelidium mucronatum]|nr:zinc-finger domain of monoamine-oxidase A repressor R1-domain-containing protein [Obelidium mucronatum]
MLGRQSARLRSQPPPKPVLEEKKTKKEEQEEELEEEEGVVIDWDKAGGVDAEVQLSEYEVERLRRLAENKKQLEALGIYKDPQAEVNVKPKNSAPRAKKPKVVASNEPRRQSGRLAGKPQEYKGLKYLDKDVDNHDIALDLRDGNSDSESGTGSSESEVELDENGRPIITGRHAKYERGGRIYDSVNGTSCHQCRQKTLDPKVKCTNMITYRNHDGTSIQAPCPLMMDNLCLEGRYGETVDVERAKGNWICPKCRGICNCSFCMAKRGKLPTGQLKNTALQLGYKSVSDMLAATGRLKKPEKASSRTKAAKKKLDSKPVTCDDGEDEMLVVELDHDEDEFAGQKIEETGEAKPPTCELDTWL